MKALFVNIVEIPLKNHLIQRGIICLYSKHVDINPGDRRNPCLGLLKPVGVEKYKDTFKILYQCETCKQTHKNIMEKEDNIDLIISLSVQK